MGDRAPGEAEPGDPPQRALLHAVEEDGEADRHEGEHDDGHELRSGRDRDHQREERAEDIHRQVRHLERVQRELLAEVKARIEVVSKDGRLCGVKWKIGERRISDERERVGDDVDADRHRDQVDEDLRRPARRAKRLRSRAESRRVGHSQMLFLHQATK